MAETGPDAHKSFGRLRHVDAGVLNVAYAEVGPEDGGPVLLLHGWRYDAVEARLAKAPAIGVPTITLEGDANGAAHSEPAAYAGKFTGRHQHRFISGGIGHNLPQEAPQAFAQAILDVDRF